VPGVGWIFTPRLPVRGAKSRAATADKGAKSDPSSAPAKAAELAKAAKKAAKRTSKKPAPVVDTSWPLTPSAPPPAAPSRVVAVDPDLSSAIDDAVAEALDPPKVKKAAKSAAKKKAPAKKAATSEAKKAPVAKKAARKKAPAEKPEAQLATAPVVAKKHATTPPPAVNEPLSFITFVAAYPVGSTIEGEVVSFTSHGAMVDVALPGGGSLHCYIPLSAMGTPPPTKAREMLTKGEVRPFVLAGLDPPRRVAELSLPVAPAKKARRTAKKAAKAKAKA
jgi:hypothetical protein